MRTSIPIGKVGERTYRIEAEHLIDFLGDQAPPVLSTPTLIMFLERTARDTVADLLPTGHVTVGIEVNMKHLAPTAAGDEVTCVCRVVGADDGVISFQVEARDSHDKIAQGFHRRRIIEVARFARYVRHKAGGSAAV